jgi:polyisoprenyl-phosphate glycosyltransferase
LGPSNKHGAENGKPARLSWSVRRQHARNSGKQPKTINNVVSLNVARCLLRGATFISRFSFSKVSTMDSHADCRTRAQKPLLSIVLPVYNEETILPLLTAKIAKTLWSSDLDYELLFVNDGSTDGSGALLDELASTSRRIRVVHLSRNFGHQAAIHAGMAHARGDALVLMNTDLTDAPEAILKMAAAWRDGYDVVYGIEFGRKSHGLHRLGERALRRLMTGGSTPTGFIPAGNFCLVDRRVAKSILELGEHDRSLDGLRNWVGFKQTTIQVERLPRYDDRPRTSFRGTVRRVKNTLFSYTSLPLKMFQLLAAASTLVFFAFGVFAIFCGLSSGLTSAMLAGSLFAALNSLGICVLGEYLIRVYDQVRNRPLYLIDRTVNMETAESSTPSNAVARTPQIAAMEEDGMEDDLYLGLMDEAMSLLQAGSAAREGALPPAVPREPAVAETQELANG